MSNDDLRDLRGVDLNLLVVFAVLMRERNVTRSAEQLHMSQAAVSAALSRLRRMLGDPLFERGPGGVVPTPHAVRLEEPVQSALAGLGRVVLGERDFDPAHQPTTFRVAMSDDLEALLLPDLIATVTKRSPGSSVRCVQTNRGAVEDLLTASTVDLAVTASIAWGPQVRSQVLFESGYAVLYDPDALGRRGPLTKHEYVETAHLMIAADGARGIVDDVLEADGLARHCRGSTAQFAMTPLLLRDQPMVATMPRHVAEMLAGLHGLEVVEPPIDLPRFTVSASWHQGRTSDPRRAWLLDLVMQIAAARVRKP